MDGETRECGDCGLCCKLLAIKALEKDAGVWCGHFRKGAGCGTYETRPGACRGFECLWLGSDGLDAAWKPNKARFLMYTEKDGKRLNVIVDPADPVAWRREPYYRRLKTMSERAYDGYELVVCIGDRRIVVFPHEDADLGIVNPEHKLVSGFAMRDGAPVSYAMVLSDTADEAGAAPGA